MVLEFYCKICQVLASVGVQFAWNKSSAPGNVAVKEMPSIGYTINLADKAIRPSSAK